MVYAPALGAGSFGSGGSSPLSSTIEQNISQMRDILLFDKLDF